MKQNPLNFADSWLYHLGDISDARMVEIGATTSDLVVIEFADYSDVEAPYTPDDLDIMRGDDTDRLMVAYMSIGEAEDYRFYWETPEFQAVRSIVLDSENPEFEGNFKIKYWLPEWQEIIFSFVDRIIDGGFNGLYLDIIDGFEYWEEEDPVGGIDYRQEMADFVAAIRAHAEARLASTDPDRTFVIIGQNGEELLLNPTYLAAIDGVGKEDLQFYYDATDESSFSVQDQEAVDYSLNLLLLAESEGKPVFVVEYLTQGRQNQFASQLEDIADILANAGIPLYLAENRTLDGVFSQSAVAIPDPSDPQTTVGTDASDVIRGNPGDDIMGAGSGNDQIWAGAGDTGNDIAVGGSGNDTLGGAAGNDFLIGDGATSAQLIAALGDSQNLNAGGGDVMFGGSGDDTLLGGGWNDSLIAENDRFDFGEELVSDTGANAIWGGTGRDLIIGTAGTDSLGGGVGDDYVDGAGGNDLVYGGRGDTADLGRNDTLLGGGGADTIFGSGGADSINGGAGDDLLFNGAGDDSVSGGAGEDILWGGPGDDRLEGGAGSDLFAFGASNGNDTISDFDANEDSLDLTSTPTDFADLAAVQIAASDAVQAGASGLLIDTGAGTSVFLVGLDVTDLATITIIL